MAGPSQVNVLREIENRLPKGVTIHYDNMTMSVVICLKDYHRSVSHNSLRDTRHNLLMLVNEVVSRIQESILNDYADGKLELSYKRNPWVTYAPEASADDWRGASWVTDELAKKNPVQSPIAPQSEARKAMYQWPEPKKPSEVVVEGGIEFDF